MQEVSSYAYTQEYHLALTDFPEVPGGDLEVTMTLAGQWAVDPAAREAMLALTEMSRAATPELADKLEAEVPAAVLEFFGGLAFDMDMNLAVSDAIAASISEDSEVPFPTELHLPMRIVDGMLYINIVDLKPLAPELEDVNADWIGFDLMGLMEQGMEDSAGELAAEPMDPMTTALVGMFYQRIFAAMEAFVDVERLDDVEVDEVQAAVFDFRPDLLGFFTSDELNTFIADMSELAGPDVDAPSQEEVAEVMMAVGFMAPMLFRDLELSVTSTIGVEDSYQYALSTLFDWDLTNLMRLAAMSDDGLKELLQSGQKPAIEFAFDGNYWDFNEETTIVAPEDVEIIPLDQCRRRTTRRCLIFRDEWSTVDLELTISN